MPHFFAWCGYLGAWLLVAGSLDQGQEWLLRRKREHIYRRHHRPAIVD